MKTLLIFLCLLPVAAEAQTAQTTDSVRTERSTEDPAVSASEFKRMIRYITRADVEEKTLIKLGLWPVHNNGMGTSRPLFGLGFKAETTVERKLTPAFSVYGGFDYAYYYARYERVLFNQPITGLTTSTDKLRNITVAAKVGTRYYYAMAKRVREGKSANNFSGNYIGFQVDRYLLSNLRRRWYDVVSGDSREGLSTGMESQPSFSLYWGFQRRIGRLGYIDLSAGPSYRFGRERPLTWGTFPTAFRQVPTGRSLSLQINALIGLGW